jgi:hypothetical protein
MAGWISAILMHLSLLCMDEMPDTRVHLVGSDISPTGLGKDAVSLVGIAMAKTGWSRHRKADLPFADLT